MNCWAVSAKPSSWVRPMSCAVTMPSASRPANTAVIFAWAARQSAARIFCGGRGSACTGMGKPVTADSSACTSGIIALTTIWLPPPSRTAGFAPASSSICTGAHASANSAARYSAVRPPPPRCSSGLPASMSRRSTCRCWSAGVSWVARAAHSSAVKPWAFSALTSAPAARPACTAATSAARAAAQRSMAGEEAGAMVMRQIRVWVDVSASMQEPASRALRATVHAMGEAPRPVHSA